MTDGRALPVEFHPLRLADSGRVLRGELPLSTMRRLGENLLESSGAAEVELHVGRDGNGRAVITGSIRATLPLLCERCLERLDLAVVLDVALAVVESEQEALQLPESLDPLVVDADPVRLGDLVEDELILGLPVVAKHPEGEACQPAVRVFPGNDAPGRETSPPGDRRQANPFSSLARLKSRSGDDHE